MSESKIPDNDELNTPEDDESKISSSNDELIKTIKQTTTAQQIVAWIVIATLGIFIFYLIFSYLSILLKYKPILDWAHNQGAKEYKNKLNMFNIVSAKSNAILYFISNTIFTPPTAQLTIDQTKFLLNRIFPYQTFVDPDTGVQEGVVTMLSLVKSVLPEFHSNLSPDKKFDDWVGVGTRGGYPVSVSDTNTDKLRYIQTSFTYGSGDTDWPEMQSSTLYAYKINKDCLSAKKTAPLWPADNDTVGWAGLIYEWLNGPSSTKNDNDDAPEPKDKSAPYFYVFTSDDGALSFIANGSNSGINGVNLKNRYRYWFGDNMNNPQPDNWIARMGIPFNSPLITGFINNNPMIGNQKMDPQAFQNLIGNTGGDIAGGWVGYAQGMGENMSLDDLINMLNTSEQFRPPIPPPPCQPTGTSSFIAGAGPILGAALFYAAAPEGAALLPIMGIGLAQGGLSVWQDQTKC